VTASPTPKRARAIRLRRKSLPEELSAGGELLREDLAPAVPVDADGDVHRPGAHHPALPDPFMAG
jgi:hypothetical protein